MHKIFANLPSAPASSQPETAEQQGQQQHQLEHHQQHQVQQQQEQQEQEQQEQQEQQQQQQQQQVPSIPKMPDANNRSILILREIAPDTDESSVRDIFNSENCPSKPVHCEYALHNSWYVTFSNDEDARLALAFIRKHTVKWRGKPIMARYKPKPAAPSTTNEVPPIHHHSPHHHHHHHHHHHPHPHPHAHPHHPQQDQIMPTMVMQQQPYQPPALPGGPPVPTSVASLNHTSGLIPPTYGGHSHNNPQPAQATATAAAPPPPSAVPVPPPPPPHHHHPDGTMLHHQHHLAHMMGPPQQHHPHHQMAPGYSPYYNQHGQLVHAPWDLSSVFIYNGLSPYNKSSGLSSVALVGGGYHHLPNQPQPHHHQ